MAKRFLTAARNDYWLVFSFITCVFYLLFGNFLVKELADPFWLGIVFFWLFAVILGSALSVVRHADHLAIRLGEPYGTLILTLSVTFIEVMSITAVMLHGTNNPTLTRDTLFSVVMIVLNGMVGVALLLGGLRHKEQHYNLQGANSYISVIVPLVGLSLILPNFTQTTSGPTLSLAQNLFVAGGAISLYVTFVIMQTGRHRGYFTFGAEGYVQQQPSHDSRSILPNAVLLILYMMLIVYLVEQLAHPVDYFIETLHAPTAIGGVIMAILVATPEALGAIRAAMANHVQRSLNILLGSVLSTIGLTIPAMILISHFTGRSLILGIQHTDEAMLVITLMVSVVTLASGHTNIIQGAVHLILFAAYVMLLLQN